MKRKDYEDKYDDFSSPSSKTRRLDPDILQFTNEDPTSTVPEIMDHMLQEQHLTSSNIAPIDALAGPVAADDGYEKALVIYNPTNTPLFKSPKSYDFSIVVNSNLIPGLKDRFWWLEKPKMAKPSEEETSKEKTTNVSDKHLALVPWVASHGDAQALEPMEAEEVEMMDADDDGSGGRTDAVRLDGMVEGANGGLQQRQQLQQHCVIPELFQNAHTTPVTW
ncbi:DBH-like monooxygenase [Trema orientale]|uniref:DBH-like monooxygenase n=1 Tax=Trema orientale TaxID=63057 RepID=A0A2P5G1I6_TREOI|nr:DBH-like monooxygenase [Trema orientale]